MHAQVLLTLDLGMMQASSKCLEERRAGMMEAVCKITQQKLENVASEMENCCEQVMMKVSGWAEAEKGEPPGFCMPFASF